MTRIDEVFLSRRSSDLPRTKLGSSEEAAKYVRKFYFDDIEIYESMFLVLLSTSLETIGWAKLSQGGIAGTVFDIKRVLRYALEGVIRGLATQVIIVHNHPSGRTAPSDKDKEITAKLAETLSMIDCTLIDSIILSKDDYYSFADNGVLPKSKYKSRLE